MSPKTREGKTFSRQPLHIQQDIKTILYSIIFYTAAQAPLGATGIWFGGQERLFCLRKGKQPLRAAAVDCLTGARGDVTQAVKLTA